MSGLLISGVEVAVAGLEIVNRHDAAWARLDARDCRKRRTPWVRQIIIHTTKGKHPQRIIPGLGPSGADRRVAEFWHGDPAYSGAHLVVDRDGSIACLADLVDDTAHHAELSNEWSVGIEMYQEGDGGIYDAVLASTVLLVRALCTEIGIPFQVAADTYVNRPIARMVDGGRDCVGIFGHRDNTSSRGRGDPGDAIYARLAAAGAELLDFGERQDLAVWRARQRRLNACGQKLTCDGVCGPGTVRAMRELGFEHGREIDAMVEDPRNA